MARYTIGVDFGTLSVRALLVNAANGEELAIASYTYPHGVMSKALPDGTLLPPDWALQHPSDYVEGIRVAVREVLRKACVRKEEIIGLGIDFTSSTSLPVDEQNQPLCFQNRFASNPYAWPMLWKHHAAQVYADRMTEAARKRKEVFLERCGGRISSELMFPRLWQIAAEAPEIYEAVYRFIEAGDWIIQLLTGTAVCSANPASYKLFWNEKDGFPSEEFFSSLDQRLSNVLSKLSEKYVPLGSCAGCLHEYGASVTGLLPGTPVSATCIDAHTALPAAGVTESKKMLLILGTSAAHLVLAEKEFPIEGILCRAKDGIIPGWHAYEAGQSCCGDHFQWLVDRFVSAHYEQEAKAANKSLHQLLTEKAAKLKPGECGLLALDWWNGNRSILMNSSLSGLLIGLTLQTKPEEVYRALIEATAFGTRVIVENYENSGIPIEEIYVCGGIAKRNPMLMQIYSDVLKKELKVVRSDQANALGTAIFAAVAAGKANGGYDSIAEAAKMMGGCSEQSYRPVLSNSEVYDLLFKEYMTLHDHFGLKDGMMERVGQLLVVSGDKT